MEKYNLKEDLEVFGKQVKTFPNGIGEAFDALVKMLPGGFDRSFYGIAYMSARAGSDGENNKMIYIAAALEISDGEAKKYNCEKYTIEKGEYLTETITEWRHKTDSIKDVFNKMMQDSRVDKTKPCVEWYKNDNEMLCMVKAVVHSS